MKKLGNRKDLKASYSCYYIREGNPYAFDEGTCIEVKNKEEITLFNYFISSQGHSQRIVVDNFIHEILNEQEYIAIHSFLAKHHIFGDPIDAIDALKTKMETKHEHSSSQD